MDNGAIYQKGIVVHLLIVTTCASPAVFYCCKSGVV